MHLKRMELKGFKSFADHTEIFFQPGINIIVGPNGCGKSNVVDAIRWVMGEANIHTIRGQRNEDIIFNGTDQNRALGMASVEITLDNSDRLLGIDMAEISISRKLFRSGESEYHLNRTRVRLKDIQALFMGTGVGKRGYSIVGQGELEQVLNGHPLDRRLYLEEASGISKHRQQREEVLRRIANTKADLVRVQDILNELSSHKEQVYEKAQKATAYKKLLEEHRSIERALLQYELLRIDAALKQRNGENELLQDKIHSISQQVDEMTTQLERMNQSIEARRALIEQLKEQRYGQETSIQSLLTELKLSEERLKNAQERIQVATEDRLKYEQMGESISTDLARVREEFKQESHMHQLKVQSLRELLIKEEQLVEQIKHYESNLEQIKTELFQARNEESTTRNQIRAGEEKLTRLKERYHRFEIQKEELIMQQQRVGEELQRCHQQIMEIKSRTGQMELEMTNYGEENSRLTTQLKKTETQLADLQRQRMRIENELLAIQERQKARVGYASGVKMLMQEDHRAMFPGIIGVVGEMIEVPIGLEVAIETAAGKGLENIVVSQVSEARQAIEYLKVKKAGRVTFLPLDVLRPVPMNDKEIKAVQNYPGVIGLAARLVSCAREIQPAVDYLLGRVLIVEDMDSGINLLKQERISWRMVTLEGESFAVGGALTGGLKSRQPEGLLQRRQAERSLLTSRQNIDKDIMSCQGQIDSFRQQLAEVNKYIERLHSSITEDRIHVQLLEQQNKEYEQQLERLKDDKSICEAEIADAVQQIKELEEEILSLKQKLQEREIRSNELTQALEQSRLSGEDSRREIEIHRARVASYREQLEIKDRELENLQRSMEQMEQIDQSYRQSAQDAQILYQKLTQEIKREEQRIAELEQVIAQGRTQLQKINGKLEKEQQAEAEERQNAETISSRVEPVKQELAHAQQRIHQNELLVARLETEQQGLMKRWTERFAGEDYKNAVPNEIKEGVRERRKQLAEIEAQMAQLEPVDLTAIQEYQQISERYEFLSQQVEDLTEAEKSLGSLLRETENLMMKDFLQFLEIANRSFQETFTEMFNGGEASLVLQNQEETLDAGVDFAIKLPGKKVQSLNLLSGGERALTCIAFIFSLLKLKPTPFCLLDEIDASLDETNLIRYTQFLKSMAERMQFVIVTHRQATIECGNHLYGVTMPEKGISKIFTLDMSQAEILAG
ncbi:MAG: chromosome segregation protein SMC [Syntrophomonadaceae bacterium]|nr:chromosome segregation protein SMC [Bacillota bacterium]NLM87671.1 chromosome segregation protein SMC [Syntrophomonadaceae bacterium]HAA08970.1 chromosome segregation protein SMC [Syntrophomonas sp.]HQA49905.1 chromosome segregation protein SMC [Syntrophomonadaceae bacterium]HQD90581.1 chromosome segregation protein SMC [Syntrophomonadaceae bacterium]